MDHVSYKTSCKDSFCLFVREDGESYIGKLNQTPERSDDHLFYSFYLLDVGSFVHFHYLQLLNKHADWLEEDVYSLRVFN